MRPWGTQQIHSVSWQSQQEGSSGMTWRNGEAPGVTLIRRKHPCKTQGGRFGGKKGGFEGWKGRFMGKKGGGKGDLWIFPCSRNKRQHWEKH